MVASIAQLTSAATSVAYYAREGQLAEDEPLARQASRWHGKGAATLGLSGPVDAQPFRSILEGHVPGTGIRLGSRRKGRHQHRPGVDLVFSAPKSVALEALFEQNEHVVDAHDHAVREALDWIEGRFLETRGFDRATGTRPRIRAGHLVAATFRHVVSRNHDPQVHTHCVIANMTRSPSERWRPVDATSLRRNKKLIGAFYRHVLAERLHGLGLVMVATMVGPVPGFEIAGYDQAFLDEFSSRRRDILEHLDRLGLPRTSRAAAMAALVTRPPKTQRRIDELRSAWKERASQQGLRRTAAAHSTTVDPPWPDRSVLEIVWRAVEALEARMSTIAATDLEAVALGHAPGRHDPAVIREAMDWLCRDGHLVRTTHPRLDEAFTTPRIIDAERVLAAWVNSTHGETLASAGELKAMGTALDITHRRSLEELVLSRRQVVGLRHTCGDDPSLLLRPLIDIARERPLLGLAAPTASLRATGLRCSTLDAFLIGATTAGSHVGGLLLVDEASTIPALDMARIATKASRLGFARTILLTRTRERVGEALRAMIKAGLRSVDHGADAGLVETARLVHARRIPSTTVRPVIEVSYERLADEACHLWLSLAPTVRDTIVILAATPELEGDIQDCFSEGKQSRQSIVVGRLVERDLDADQLADPAVDEAGDVVVSKGSLSTVMKTHESGVELMDARGYCHTFTPSGTTARSLRLHQVRPVTLHVSDRLCLPGTGMATVVAIKGRTVHLETGDGIVCQLDRDDSALRQASPAWSHVDGGTCGAIVVLDSGDPDGQASFARSVTGAIDECVILTDNGEDLVTHYPVLQTWSHAAGDHDALKEGEYQAMSANLVARIDRHCRSWTDVRSTPRASHWMIHARSLLNEAREHHLHAAASCLDTLCRRQEAMTHRSSSDVRLSIR